MELKGKIIDFLGDSITEGVGVSDLKNRSDCRYGGFSAVKFLKSASFSAQLSIYL